MQQAADVRRAATPLEFAITVGSLAAAAAIAILLRPFIGAELYFPPFTLAVLVSAAYGGLWPGLVATLLGSAATAYLIAAPTLSLVVASPADLSRVLFFAGIGVVISLVGESRRRALEREARERQWLELTMASMGDALVIADERGRVLFVNAVGEELMGLRLAEMRGRPIAEVFRIVNETTRAPVGDPVEKVIKTGRTSGLANHTVLLRPDGSERQIDDSAAPVRTANGALAGVVLLFRDITARRAAEAERARLLEAAEQASRLKDEFISTISHELRTPLTAILGWTSMLEKGVVPAEQADRAHAAISRNATALARLVDDLLDASRIVTGKMRLDVGPIDLRATIDAAVESVRPAADAKGITVEVESEPMPPFPGDAARLQQVFWNLLSNAIKFTPRGGEIDVRAWRRGTDACISVRDNGAGIPAEFLPFVFDRFSQLATPGQRNTAGGLGLGLAIVRQLVELHGGIVSVTSAGPGAGATFTVELPMPAVVSSSA